MKDITIKIWKFKQNFKKQTYKKTHAGLAVIKCVMKSFWDEAKKQLVYQRKTDDHDAATTEITLGDVSKNQGYQTPKIIWQK